MKRILSIFLTLVMAGCFVAGLAWAVSLAKNKRELRIAGQVRSYELATAETLVLSGSDFPSYGGRPIVIEGDYNFPFKKKKGDPSNDHWGLDMNVEITGAAKESKTISREYVQSGFVAQLAKCNVTEGSTIKLTVTKLTNVPRGKIQIRVGREHSLDAKVTNEVLTILLIVDAIVLLISAVLLWAIRAYAV